MRDLPSGTVTFLFTDVEGSTRRWERDSPTMHAAVERHFGIIDQAIGAHGGMRFKTIGDAVQAAFATATDAVLAAVDAQRALLAEDWGDLGPFRVRMAIHTGSATPRDGDYLAAPLNRLARLISAGTGEQILLTEATRHLVHGLLPADIQLRDLGQHRLRDLRDAEHVYQILAPGLPADFPPLKSLDLKLHNLPVQLTPFVGRDRESAEARALLAEPGVRLLTLTGPGGTGKTRLSLRVAGELLDEYRDGVWFVPLALAASGGNVASAIAEALGLREIPGESAIETVRAHLASRRLLLVLDNFEHVLDAAPLIADLLAGSPELQVLATSRAPLRITGEHELPVPPLSLPDERGGVRLDEAMASEAVRLFVERAKAARPNFVLDESNAATIVKICRRLDGLPLAIELAAARIKLLPPEAVLARLDKGLSLLTGGGRDRPERQQTLRAAIAWSHDLLDENERALFRRLAVFTGGWTIEEAEAVANAPGLSELPVIDCLESLHDNSLIRQDEATSELADPRFLMLQTIQEFGREQLAASGELDEVSDAHAALFSRLAAEAEPQLTGPDAITWLDRLEADQDNLRSALSWLRRQGNIEGAVRLVAALWRFWWLRGQISEGRDELKATLELAGEGVAAPVLAAALDGAGFLAETQGDYQRAIELHEQALALSKDADDRAGVARALGNLGVVTFDQGDRDRATSLLEESLALAREVGDSQLIATSLNDLGLVVFAAGDLSRAETLYRESLGLRRQSANQTEIARSLNNLGALAIDREEFAAARDLFEESLELYRETGDKWGAAGVLINLSLAIRNEGDAARATRFLERSLALFEETGDVRNAAVALLHLAETQLACGQVGEAVASYRDALTRFHRLHSDDDAVRALAGLAKALSAQQQFDGAARLLAAASTLSEADDPDSPPLLDATFEDDVAAVREALGEAAFASAWESGRGYSLEDAVAAATRTAARAS